MCVCSLCYLLLAVTLLLITPITNSHTHRTGSSFSRAGFVYILYTIVRVILKKKLGDDTLLSSSLHEAKRGWRFAITWRRTGDDLPVATGEERGGLATARVRNRYYCCLATLPAAGLNAASARFFRGTPRIMPWVEDLR